MMINPFTLMRRISIARVESQLDVAPTELIAFSYRYGYKDCAPTELETANREP